jgi:hypothetical protein
VPPRLRLAPLGLRRRPNLPGFRSLDQDDSLVFAQIRDLAGVQYVLAGLGDLAEEAAIGVAAVRQADAGGTGEPPATYPLASTGPP